MRYGTFFAKRNTPSYHILTPFILLNGRFESSVARDSHLNVRSRSEQRSTHTLLRTLRSFSGLKQNPLANSSFPVKMPCPELRSIARLLIHIIQISIHQELYSAVFNSKFVASYGPEDFGHLAGVEAIYVYKGRIAAFEAFAKV
jgi:hypothetical protein